MKSKLIIFILIILLFTSYKDTAYANILKSSHYDNKNIYYVDNDEKNILCLNLIKSNMEDNVTIVYSGKLAPQNKTQKYLNEYYLDKFFSSNSTYQDNIYIRSNNVVSDRTYIINSIKYNNDETITVKFDCYYIDSTKESKYVTNKINKAIIDNVLKLTTDYDKALWAYQWVLNNVHYDFEKNNRSVYSGITDGGTVCAGYSFLYSLITEKLGLTCRYIKGTVSNSEFDNHAWNIIKLNGKWYCVDTTWGDYYGADKYFLRTIDILSTPEYGYHESKVYDNYIKASEVFATSDYDNTSLSEYHSNLPSVYNIKIDALKYNIIDIGEGYTFMLSNPDNVQISFKSENPNIAKVDDKGIITGVGYGITTISAFNKDLNIEQNCIITVIPCYDHLTLSIKNANIKVGSFININIENNLGGSSIKFISSNPSIAKIQSKNGKITAIKKGKCKITCIITNGTYICKLSCSVSVK